MPCCISTNSFYAASLGILHGKPISSTAKKGSGSGVIRGGTGAMETRKTERQPMTEIMMPPSAVPIDLPERERETLNAGQHSTPGCFGAGSLPGETQDAMGVVLARGMHVGLRRTPRTSPWPAATRRSSPGARAPRPVDIATLSSSTVIRTAFPCDAFGVFGTALQQKIPENSRNSPQNSKPIV